MNTQQMSEDAALDSLLADLTGAPSITVSAPAVTDIAPVEAVEPEGMTLPDLTEARAESVDLSAVEALEAEEAVVGDQPTEDPKAAEKLAREVKKQEKEAAKKAAAEKKAKEAADKKAARDKAKAEKEAAKVAAGTDEEPAAPKEKRQYFAKKEDRIKYRLGEKLGDFMVLELDDANLEGDALKAKQDETFKVIAEMSVKVKNRASLLLDFVAGKTAKLNNVIATAFKVLSADGKLTTGDNGNLHAALLKKPYSPSAARAMGRNTITLMEKLKVINKTAKGEFVANPNSLLLANVKAMLAL